MTRRESSLWQKAVRVGARAILRRMPLIAAPRANVLLNRLLGYSVDWSVRLYSSVQIMGDIQVLIGPRTFLGHETVLTGGAASIRIGADCDVSDRVGIFCGTHEVDDIGPRSAGLCCGKDIIIGNGVWIGFGALVLPGVSIGDKAVVGAGSVVHKDVAPRTVVAGNPLRVIRTLGR